VLISGPWLHVSLCLQMVDKRTFVRPIYAGNGMATVAVEPSQKLIMATVSALLRQQAGSSAGLTACTVNCSVAVHRLAGLSRACRHHACQRRHQLLACAIRGQGRGLSCFCCRRGHGHVVLYQTTH
jgi:electron transfer flavoprotein alpha subunit